jgi:transcription elongation factor Elf1
MPAPAGQNRPMNKLMEQVEAEITCGQCGHKVKKPVAWLVENSEFACAMCGEVEDLSSPEWQQKIRAYIDACSEFDV